MLGRESSAKKADEWEVAARNSRGGRFTRGPRRSPAEGLSVLPTGRNEIKSARLQQELSG